MRALVLSFLACVLCFLATSAPAAPRAVLVLRPELTAEAVFGPGSPFAALLPHAAIGVMNTAVRGPHEPASAYRTLGAGDRVAAGPPTAAAPLRSGSGSILPGRALAAEGLGEALRPRGGVAWLGVRETARTRADNLNAFLSRAPLVVLDLPPSFDTRRLAALLATLGRDPGRDVLLVSPYPPPGVKGAWDRLPPILGLGPDFPPGYLTSSTTRTPGLVANIDVAPSLLAALAVRIPGTMTGRVMRTEGPADAAALLRFAQAATLAQRAVVPLGIGTGIAAVVPLILTLLVFWGQRPPESGVKGPPTSWPARSRFTASPPWLPPLARTALLLVAASPLAMLLAPLVQPVSVAGLGIAVAGCAAAAATAAAVLSRSRLPIHGSRSVVKSMSGR